MQRYAAWDNNESQSPRAMRDDLSLREIEEALPSRGLFRSIEGENSLPWLPSPRPFCLSKKEVRFLQGLGPVLDQFYQISDHLYRASLKKNQHPWLSKLLNTGKPEALITLQGITALVGKTPQVIRPDLMLSEDGFSITELDSVPGGIGVTAWLSKTYANKGWEVLGGAEGMIAGFASLFPEGADIVISEEANDYKPEMQYLQSLLGENFSLHDAENYHPQAGRALYRFFELFDAENIPFFEKMCSMIEHEGLKVSPPIKPHFEEKLWLALFHTPGLQGEWKSRLRGASRERLLSVIPPSWVLDPTPLPPQAAHPYLNINRWEELMNFSQKERHLVAKISGFHESAWGARGVYVGHDLSGSEWSSVIEKALSDFTKHPWILQQFVTGRIVEHPYFEEGTGNQRIMQGRVRLCPYYFKDATGFVKLGGCLATIVPADKKKIHGMKDGILVPCIQG